MIEFDNIEIITKSLLAVLSQLSHLLLDSFRVEI